MVNQAVNLQKKTHMPILRLRIGTFVTLWNINHVILLPMVNPLEPV